MKPYDSASMNSDDRKTIVIAGAGPAGLTLACELTTQSDQFRPVIAEATGMTGGLARTVNYKGNRIDIGGHRFFSKSQRVLSFWEELMPTEPAADPAATDRVMLRRPRVSHIYYLRRFFNYPVTLSLATLKALGWRRTVSSGLGYLWAQIHKLPLTSLENFYINRFGRPLYRMFFERYTEKVWGKHPSTLGADWGAQRVKGLSVRAVLRDILLKKTGLKQRAKVETSLIEEFIYPKYGPGQLWELAAERAVDKGAELMLDTKVVGVHVGAGNCIDYVTVQKADGSLQQIACDAFASSMPVKDLIAALDGPAIPEAVSRAAATLPYRDFITVGLLVPRHKVRNLANGKSGQPDDTWIYVQEPDVKLGRIQLFNNWSPYMLADDRNNMWLGLEYFCNEGDQMWQMNDSEFIEMATKELSAIGIIDPEDVVDAVRIKMPKAYPAYHSSYADFDKIREFLDSIPNLYCIGRNGQHRYNNMDHSMLTAMTAADAILRDAADKSALWAVNTDNSYHEKK